MQSLWSVTAAPGPECTPARGELRADVIVIGAGYTGLSAALDLSRAGRDVVVLEAAALGEGASGLNGGQVIPGVKHDPDTLEKLFGPRRGPALVKLVAAGPDRVFELVRQYGIACAATRTGWIQAATSDSALQMIMARVAQWRRRGADVEMLSSDELVRLTGSRRYQGGWIDRRGGTVQPLSYVRGLARAAAGAGARLHTHTPVLKLERAAGRWHCATPAAGATAPTVIIATNAYTDALVDRLRRSIIPVPSFQVATEPLPPQVLESVLPHGQSVSDTWRLLRYFRLDPGGRLLMGSRGAFGNAPPSVVARLHYRAVREIFPQLGAVRYDYHWGGLVAMTRDHLPHLHEIAPGLLAGLGYNGRGVAMATLMGGLLARWALGQPAQELDFPVTPLDAIPLHRFNQLGVRLAVAGLRALDGLTRWRNRLLTGGAS